MITATEYKKPKINIKQVAIAAAIVGFPPHEIRLLTDLPKKEDKAEFTGLLVREPSVEEWNLYMREFGIARRNLKWPYVEN